MRFTDLPILESTPTELTFAVNAEGAVVTGCSEQVTQVTVPASYSGVPVVRIGSQAFMQHPHLLSITLPDSVRTIGEAAFMGCPALTSVRAGTGLEQVQPHAFFNCVNLQQVDFPSRPVAALTSFAGCYQLEAAREGVTYR